MGLFEFTLLRIGVPVLVAGGLFGNVLSAIVFRQKEMRSPFTILLIGLSLADSIFLAGRFFIFGAYFSIPYFVYCVSFIAQTSSGYFTVAISYERYNGICRPLASYNSLTSRKVTWASLLIVVMCCFINIPEMYYTIHGLENYNFIVYLVYDAVLKVIIPLVLLFWFNVSIYREIKKQAVIRGKDLGLTQQNDSEKSTYKVLLLVVLMFAFCHLPFIVYFVQELCRRVTSLQYTSEESNDIYKDPSVLWTWLKFTTTLNSSVNFLIYFCVGSKFKHVLFNIFKKRPVNQVSLQGTQVSNVS